MTKLSATALIIALAFLLTACGQPASDVHEKPAVINSNTNWYSFTGGGKLEDRLPAGHHKLIGEEYSKLAADIDYIYEMTINKQDVISPPATFASKPYNNIPYEMMRPGHTYVAWSTLVFERINGESVFKAAYPHYVPANVDLTNFNMILHV
jgi:hypothetical protein